LRRHWRAFWEFFCHAGSLDDKQFQAIVQMRAMLRYYRFGCVRSHRGRSTQPAQKESGRN
jgi:hypothetical protein